MKKLINLVFWFSLAFIILALGYTYYISNKSITRQEFQEAHEKLNLKIDSLERITKRIDLKTDTVMFKIDSINNSIDTLKKGQSIIYEQVKKSKTNFWEMF